METLSKFDLNWVIVDSENHPREAENRENLSKVLH